MHAVIKGSGGRVAVSRFIIKNVQIAILLVRLAVRLVGNLPLVAAHVIIAGLVGPKGLVRKDHRPENSVPICHCHSHGHVITKQSEIKEVHVYVIFYFCFADIQSRHC